MKKFCALLLLVVIIYGCREHKKNNEEMIPVEADGGIGDGAPSLDSILKSQKSQDTLPHFKKDTL